MLVDTAGKVTRMMMIGATVTTLLALLVVAAAPAKADFGVAPSDGAALPPGPAFWAGTCDLAGAPALGESIPGGVGNRPAQIVTDPGSPGFGVPPTYGPAPALPPDCIDAGTTNPVGTSAPWMFSPSWRLAPVTGAGAHPDGTTTFTMNRIVDPTGFIPVPDGNLRDVSVGLPPGFVGDPTAVAKCSAAEARQVPAACPPESQVGVATTVIHGLTSLDTVRSAVYNVEPRRGKTAELLISNAGALGPPSFTNIPLVARVRTESDFGIDVDSIDTPAGFPVHSVQVTLWGVPWHAAHDPWRVLSRRGTSIPGGGLPVGQRSPYDPQWGTPRPFVSNPTECTGQALTTTLGVNSWQRPDDYFAYSAAADPLSACDDVPFDGTLDATPGSQQAGASTGYAFDMSIPQSSDVGTLATGHLKKAVVVLPEGVRVNPSAADGLDGCTLAQARLDSRGDSACPPASKIGTLSVDTPLLDDPLDGSIYLGHPDSNKFDSLLSLILVARGPGVVVKIPGRIDPDPVTGQLTAVFDNNPQLPFSKLHLEFKDGARAPLTNPSTCGVKTMHTTLTAWSGKTVTDESSFEITGCESSQPFRPGLAAGTASSRAGAFSEFGLRLTRGDGDQELGGVSVDMPKGLLARIAGVERCGADAADAGSCGDGSRIGSVTVGAGSGPSPFFVTNGRAYLTGPYKGAPFGLSIVVPAVAGPFDLGTVTVRSALFVDSETAEVSVVSDRFPEILQGIRLQVRDVRVAVDRPDFIVNPTSCSEKEIRATVTSTEGATAAVADRFQAADCAALPFKPRIALRLTGPRQVTTGKHPGVRAQVNQTGIGEAGIAKAVVRLPKSLALDPDNAQALCEFEAGTKPDLENHCPKGSIVGRARAKTPLLGSDLVGNVYFVKNVRKDPTTGNLIRTLPMLIVALRGEIAINLRGESSTTKAGRLVNTFANVPDAPITQFNLNIAGGPNGILAVTRTRKAKINLCATRQIAEVDTDGQNGRRHDFDTTIQTPCTKAQIKKAKRAAAKAAKGRP